jgi:Na+/melibiose symporter-like transporter
VLVTLFVQDVREPVSSRFDWVGLFLSGTGLASLMFGLETIGRGVVEPAYSVLALAAGLLAGLLYAVHARRHAAPLLDFTLLRYRTFLVSCVAGTLFRVGIGAIPFLLPMMLQLSFGKSAVESGMITFASSLGALAMKPAATAALRRMGFRDTLVWNAGLSSVLLGAVAFFRPSWPVLALYVVLLVGGFFRSLQFTAYNALAYAEIPRHRISAATSFYATVQQVSLTLGVSAGAASLTVSMALGRHGAPMVSDFSTAFLVVAGVALLSLPVCLLMPRGAGTEMSGHHRA